jgi:hypothetical protein
LARRAAILLAHIRQHDEEVGSDIADTYRKYSIVDSAQRMVGFEEMIQGSSRSGSAASPGRDYREKSIVELILAGDLEKAEETYSRLSDFFETHRGFVAQLGNLQSTYEAVKEDVPGDERPEVEIRAEEFLIIGGDGNTITPVEDASHLSALVSEATELSTLYALLIRVHKRSGLGAAILSHLAPDQNWTEEDRSSFHAARADLFGARGDLWAARTLSETDIQNVEKQTESALVALRRLADRHPPRTLPTTTFALQSYAFDLLDTSTIDGVSEIMGWADHLLSKLVQSFRLLPIDDSDLTANDLQDAARKSRRLTLLVDWLILALGWVVAAITATVALYVQKAFGSSLLDYAYALLWGVGVERSLTGLNSVLKMLGMGGEA